MVRRCARNNVKGLAGRGTVMSLGFRQLAILDLARSAGQLRIGDLAAHFQVTLQTVRRDLNDLAEAGHLSRVDSGAVLKAPQANLGYRERVALNAAAKPAIGAARAAKVPTSATLVLTIGTTTEAVARAVFLVADHSKLGRRAPARIGALSEVDAIFTVRALPGPLARLCQDWDCTVHVAGQGAGLGAGLGAGRVGARLRPIAIFANLQSLAMKAPHLAAKSVAMGFVARCPALPPGAGSFGRIQHVQSDFDRLCPRPWSDGRGIRKHRDSGS